MREAERQAEIAVVGGGPAGLVAALSLARAGFETLLFAPPPPHPDRRTTALLGVSVDTLRDLGVWDNIAANTAPLRKLRLVDGTRRLVRTPEVLFDSAELGLEAFGYNIENEVLLAALRETIAHEAHIKTFTLPAAHITPRDNDVTIALADGTAFSVRLVAAADGRNSVSRAAAGISTTKRPLPQSAIALNFSHSRPHHDISTEFHLESGPFTLVPLPGNRSSLVWVCTPDEAERIRAVNDIELSAEIECRSASIVGEVKVNGARGIFPLHVEIAERFAASRVALIGEAGHVLPPIGAQGLNLGIRDAVAIAEIAARNAADPGSEIAMAAFDSSRRTDVRSRAIAVEWLGRSLLSGFLPVHMARGLGLEFASRIGPLRRLMMRAGLGESVFRTHLRNAN